MRRAGTQEATKQAVTPSARTIVLPPAGAAALLTALGILEDNGVRVDVALFLGLSNKLHGTWTPAEWDRMSDEDEREVTLTIAEADLVLQGLAFTEAMSVDLPWYPMVIETVRFVGDRLTGLWSSQEWLAWRDGRAGRGPVR